MPEMQMPSAVMADDDAVSLIAEHVKGGQCILFLGAGVHRPPSDGSEYSYPAEQRPPTSRELAKQLAYKCKLAQKYPNEDLTNLQRVSLFYEKTFDRQALVNEVKSAVGDRKKPSPIVRALAQLDFRLILTTNYDQLFEMSLNALDKRPRVSVYSPDENKETLDENVYGPERPFIFKIHGDIDNASSIVITDEDYIQFVLRMSDKDRFHPVPETFRYFFKRWPTLFVGYSLMDYNLRLLFKTLRWKVDPANRPATYSVDLYPDPLILDVWQNQRRYVKFIAQDVWTFVPKLYQEIKGQAMP